MPGPSGATDVVAVLVSHDGATWLPAVLRGLRHQSAPISGLVAVDTGSKDGSDRLIEETWGSQVTRLPRETSYPQAIRAALDTLRAQGRRPEWLWLLHDDANPAPGALWELLTAAAEHPEASILGPKLREWPSLRRLLELGVTISGTGRRETGLERGEYDQGQHDEIREVLAVNSAGMLIRRDVLEQLGGFDEQLPIFGNDIDLGWRAAAAGRTTMIVPRAVVFHAEAAHRGVRTTALTGRHTHYQERRAALYTLLANCRGRVLPFRAVRLLLGSVLRMLGFLLVRSPGEALDELAAVLSVLGRPGQLLAGRRDRRRAHRGREPDRDRVARLLAPWWLPYRHGLDFVGDLVAAATNQAADVAERRRIAAAERDPSPPAPRHSTDEDEIEDTGLVVRLLTDPVAVVIGVALVAYLIGSRGILGAPEGGALSALPESAAQWWRLYAEASHPLGFGTEVPAPAYVPALALPAAVLGPTATMTFLFLLTAPFAMWGAWRFLRVVGRLLSRYGAPRWLLLWGSATYALVPLVSGAWGGERFGVLVAATLLPWLAHAALGFVDPEASRRWLAAWRSALLLALMTAFAPVTWWWCAVLLAVGVGAMALFARSALADRTTWGPPVAGLLTSLLLLVPWWLPALWHGAAGGLVLDVGRWPTDALDGLHLALGRFVDLGAPAWLGWVLPVLALLALVPRASRIPVVACWLAAAVTALVALPLGSISVELLGGTGQQPGLGVLVVVLQACWVTATVLGGQSALEAATRSLARSGVLVVTVGALLVPVAGLVWFAVWGSQDLAEPEPSDIPVYMAERASSDDEAGILLIRGSVPEGLTYHVQRGSGTFVGEDEIEALSAEDSAATALVRELATAPSPEAVRGLAERGVAYIVMPAPVDGNVAARIDATGGLRRASTEDRDTRAWRMVREPAEDAVDGDRSWVRVVLLALQAVAVPAVVVLSLPSIGRTRR